MPRAARSWDPGGVIHVDSRGFEGAPLFLLDEDRSFVVAAAEKVFAETHVRCLAWAVLRNHYHFLIQCDSTAPGVVFQRLNTRIAVRARRRRGERGPVFQSRYFSRLCTDDRAWDCMLAYVLGNPLHHRVVESVEQLERYPWSGLGEILGHVPRRLVDVDCVLGRFHDRPDLARASVRGLLHSCAAAWIAEGDAGPEQLPVSRRLTDDEQLRQGLRGVVGIVDPVIGDWESRGARRVLLERDGWTPEMLLVSVCSRLGADPSRLRSGARSAAETLARSVIAFVACDFVGRPAVEVARSLSVSVTATTAARRRGRELIDRLRWDPAAIVNESRPTPHR